MNFAKKSLGQNFLSDKNIIKKNADGETLYKSSLKQLKEKQDVIPAVTHVDGSARLQTVTKELHPRYYDLIKKLGDKTGVPVVLNTSFNIQGEPVVESPQDAVRCFFSTGLDFLVIGDFIISK